MWMRVTVGGHVGEIVDMPYHIALKAAASGTAEYPDAPTAPAPSVVTVRAEEPVTPARPVTGRDKAGWKHRRHAHT
jgi:hypothetical protein